ncbi:MAG TPA: SPOR domain-containing protein [Campylobacterales bacterium]|nr:SPOR domain-containing protein [Campylobacterales bacterium]
MKTKNNIAIGLSLLTLFTFSGCVTKTTNATTPYLNQRVALPISNQVCVGDNCKSTIIKSKSNKKPFIAMATNRFKQETKYEPVIETVYGEELSENITDSRYDDPYISLSVTKNYPKIEQLSKKISIQVGAFRRYAGAKIYAKRYGMLSHQYKTIIKNDIKDNKPLYRVRIEGFANEHKAKAFMSRYSLNGAFLVRK